MLATLSPSIVSISCDLIAKLTKLTHDCVCRPLPLYVFCMLASLNENWNSNHKKAETFNIQRRQKTDVRKFKGERAQQLDKKHSCWHFSLSLSIISVFESFYPQVTTISTLVLSHSHSFAITSAPHHIHSHTRFLPTPKHNTAGISRFSTLHIFL